MLDNKTLLTNTDENNNSNKTTEQLVSPRRAWGKPHETVLQALNQANVTDVNSSNNSGSLEKTINSKDDSLGDDRVAVKKGETFLISKNKAASSIASSSSSGSNLMNEKPPSIIDKLESMEATVRKIADLISPQKLATLSRTNNFLLGVTLGQFDLRNTKVRNFLILNFISFIYTY